jgi:hypothetical protein
LLVRAGVVGMEKQRRSVFPGTRLGRGVVVGANRRPRGWRDMAAAWSRCTARADSD